MRHVREKFRLGFGRPFDRLFLLNLLGYILNTPPQSPACQKQTAAPLAFPAIGTEPSGSFVRHSSWKSHSRLDCAMEKTPGRQEGLRDGWARQRSKTSPVFPVGKFRKANVLLNAPISPSTE